MTGESMVLFLLLEPRPDPCGRIGDSGPAIGEARHRKYEPLTSGAVLPGFRQELYGLLASRRPPRTTAESDIPDWTG